MITGPQTLAEALTWAVRIEAIDDSSMPAVVSAHRDPVRKERAYAHLASSDDVSSSDMVTHLIASI